MIFRTLFSLLVVAGALAAQDTPPAAPTAPAKAAYLQRQLYPLSTCVVSGENLDGDAVTFEAGGRTFKTCCEKCKPKVEKDPATYAKKLDDAIIAEQKKVYPLDTCVISGKKLGAMGDPVQLVLDGTLVQLCCDNCTKKATAQASDMAKKVRDAAFAAQAKTYPLKECPVSGEALDKDAVSVMFGTQLVRFCCEKCIKKFENEPAAFLPKLKAKAAEAPKDAAPAKPGEKKGGEDSAPGCCCVDTKPASQTKTDKAAGCCCNAGPAGDAKAKTAEKKADCCEQDAGKVKAKEEPKVEPKKSN